MRRLALFLGCLAPATAGAQATDFHHPSPVPSITATAALANFDGPGTYALGDAAAHVPAGRGFAVTASVPMIFGDAGTMVGNPFVGLIVGTERSQITGRLGVRLPLAREDDAALVGVLADFERYEAYVPDLLSVSAAAQYEQRNPSGFLFRAKLEPVLQQLVRSDVTGDRSEFLLNYGAQLGWADEATELTGAVTGRAILSAEGADLGERTVHHATLAASHAVGTLRPGVFLRLPLDDLLGDLDYVAGVTLRLTL